MEFGAGTGHNLVHAHEIFKDNFTYVGLDFAKSSIKLINNLKDELGIPITGILFDMKNPNKQKLKRFRLDKTQNKIAFTFGSIEQLAGNYKKFINMLIELGFDLIINIEPLIEFYLESSVEDSLALMFHKKRGYSQGLLKYLETLEKHNQIQIFEKKRLGFGSLMMEGYNLIVWRPKTKLN